MEFGQVLRRRRMIRSYDEARPVPSQAIDAVLAAALRAPTAGFTQGVSMLVLTGATDREAFWRLTAEADGAWLRGMRSAPVLILVWTSEEAYLDRYAEPDKGWIDRDPARWEMVFGHTFEGNHLSGLASGSCTMPRGFANVSVLSRYRNVRFARRWRCGRMCSPRASPASGAAHSTC